MGNWPPDLEVHDLARSVHLAAAVGGLLLAVLLILAELRRVRDEL